MFNYRVVGIALDADRVLLHRAEKDDFWALPGGRGEVMEVSHDTLRREMREELGAEIRIERLVWIVENFFEDKQIAFHEIALYFLISFPPDSPIYRKTEVFPGNEEGLKLIFQWFRLDELPKVRLFPSFLRKSLSAIPETTEHVVHTDVNE
jgi:ADP-ribose pyrophosphatase YjhB (NUDIX family)